MEELECTYLDEFYYFLKFAKRRILKGFDTQAKIKDEWQKEWSPDKEGKGISSFAVGAERIVYAFFNTQGFGQPNSAPVGSDLFFETDDAFIHIDMKTVQTRNIGDYTTNIFVGRNQNSYKGKMIVNKGRHNQTLRDYKGVLPTEYKNQGNPKPCLTYFITILYEEKNLNVLCITLLCMPNGILEPYYRTRVLKAGKNPDKTRFNFSIVDTFELLPKKQKRVRVVYLNESPSNKWMDKLKYLKSIYDSQTI